VPTTAPVAAAPQFNPNVAYSYRTDQELLDASRNAQAYCMNNGSRQVTSNIVLMRMAAEPSRSSAAMIHQAGPVASLPKPANT